MRFDSIWFLVFVACTFPLYWILHGTYSRVLLLIGSYFFYMFTAPVYGLLLLGVSLVAYIGSISLEYVSTARWRKWITIIGVGLMLTPLFVFKYYDFLNSNMHALLQRIGVVPVQCSPVLLQLVLPIGISFYTFQTIGYLLDVYKYKIPAERNLGLFLLFVSFFPQILAGPIGRADRLLLQWREDRSFERSYVVQGLRMVLWGAFKKYALADTLAIGVDTVFGNVRNYTGFAIVLASLMFTIQIYCDFSGYSDIAIGIARLYGIDLGENFRTPYFSQSIKEFWGRWHISLSTWFRDYVYIPLGGNRCSAAKSYVNLMVTFLVSGLWHGANWTFVFWGGVHGIGQIIEKVLLRGKSGKKNRISKVIGVLITFIFCSAAWVFFKCATLEDSWWMFSHAFTGITNISSYISNGARVFTDKGNILLMMGVLIAVDVLIYQGRAEIILTKLNRGIRWGSYILLGLFIWYMIPVNNASSFLYFAF